MLAVGVGDVGAEHRDRQHSALVKAILAGHAIRARTVMEEHCDDTAALLRGLVG
jgi:GntR family transcriptional repressor for pyruvate dehydrogenase complex